MKRGRRSELISDATHKKTVRFVLALSNMLAGLCKCMISARKGLSGLTASAEIVSPLSHDCFSAMPDGDAGIKKDSTHCPLVDCPMSGQPSETSFFDKVPCFGGIDNPAAFDGFNSFYDFLRQSFFHTRYALIDYKNTTKKSKTVVFNLSVDKDESYVVPAGIVHNCRCTVVQVRKSKYPTTNHDEAIRLGNEALQRDTKGIFRFNAGKEGKSVPDYNPYTIRKCTTCPVAKGGKSGKLAAFIPDNEVCHACVLIHRCEELRQCKIDPVYGERLKTSTSADKTEVKENTRAAYSLLLSFPTMEIKIREHLIGHGVKNPEYLINGLIGDRKGIRSINGVSDGFSKAKAQGCEVVVIDLDMRMSGKRINLSELAKKIDWRREDFTSGTMKECYVIMGGKAVRIGPEHGSREAILEELQKLKP